MPKSLPCKYFYDERGSDLFQQICELPEYYPTRTETALLKDCAGEIAAAIGPRCRLIEYGTGSSEKMRILLDALELPSAFVSVDISREHLLQTTSALARDHPEMDVQAVCADFTKPFTVPYSTKDFEGKAVAFFPGSSLGNFHHHEAVEFLRNTASVVGPGGGLVIGIDLKKDVDILNAAYSDSAGVTAAFNLNLLVRIDDQGKSTSYREGISGRCFLMMKPRESGSRRRYGRTGRTAHIADRLMSSAATMTHRCRDATAPDFSLKTGNVMEGSKLGYQTWAIA